MGNSNQLAYFQQYLPGKHRTVLEVGSLQHGNTMPFRKAIEYDEYVGVDIQAGPGVDRVVDLTSSQGGFDTEHFELIICCSVLEHVERPWLLAETLTTLLSPSGALFLAVPWIHRYHAYPEDYWRFSRQGVAVLFPELQWLHVKYATNVRGDFLEVTPSIDNAMQGKIGKRKYLPVLQLCMVGRK